MSREYNRLEWPIYISISLQKVHKCKVIQRLEKNVRASYDIILKLNQKLAVRFATTHRIATFRHDCEHLLK